MAIEVESKFEVDGVQLYNKSWTPEIGVKARLVIVHGFSAHINRYNDFCRQLTTHGIEVFGWDQRGWGQSAPDESTWGHTGSTTQVVSDIAAFIQDKLAVANQVPLFVLGHSMGGGEICTLMLDPKYQELVGQVRGWILEAPLIGLMASSEPGPVKVILARLAARLLPNYQMKLVTSTENLSRDPAVLESFRADPLCHDTGTLEALVSMFDRTTALSNGNVRLGTQVHALFLVFGTDDMTCDMGSAIRWMEQQTMVEDRITKTYADAKHELHEDYCKEEFIADVAGWILGRSRK